MQPSQNESIVHLNLDLHGRGREPFLTVKTELSVKEEGDDGEGSE